MLCRRGPAPWGDGLRPGKLNRGSRHGTWHVAGPYEVIANFVPDDLVVEDADPQPDGLVLFIGDLTRDKGIAVLIAAYRRLGNGAPAIERVCLFTAFAVVGRVENLSRLIAGGWTRQ